MEAEIDLQNKKWELGIVARLAPFQLMLQHAPNAE